MQKAVISGNVLAFIEADNAAIGEAHVHAPVTDRQAPRVGEKRAGHDGFVHLRDIRPDPFTGDGIELPDRRRVDGDIHSPVDDQRRTVQTHSRVTGLEDPDRAQFLDVRGVDLVQRAVAPRRVHGAMVGAPVLIRAVPDLVRRGTGLGSRSPESYG